MLPNYKAVEQTHAELYSFKVEKLDACIRPLFANPVTYIDTCIVYFRVLYQDGDVEVKSSIKREELERSPGEGTHMCMPRFMTGSF